MISLFNDITNELYSKVEDVDMRKGIRMSQKYVKKSSDPRQALIVLMTRNKSIGRTSIVDAIAACLAIYGSVERNKNV